MSRIAKSSPVSAKMYRHFAAITVAITAALAMFADGESREAVEEQVAQVQAPKPPEKVLSAQHEMRVRNPGQTAQFGADEPMETDNDWSITRTPAALPRDPRKNRRRQPHTFYKDDVRGGPANAPPPGPPGPWLREVSEDRSGGAATGPSWTQGDIDAVVRASRERNGVEDSD